VPVSGLGRTLELAAVAVSLVTEVLAVAILNWLLFGTLARLGNADVDGAFRSVF
jgi:hypothetical protein